MAEMTFQDQRAFSFLRTNDRGEKPRKVGVTEVRGPSYATYGLNHLEDLLRTMGAYIDSFKYAGGSFSLMPRDEAAALNDLATTTTSWSPPAASSRACSHAVGPRS